MNKKTIWIITIVAILIIGIIMNYLSSRRGITDTISEIRTSTEPMFDSLSSQMENENNLNLKIVLLIENGNLVNANRLIDSVIQKNPSQGIFHVYKAMAYAKEKNYDKALKECDTSMILDKNEFPLALGKKGDVFIELKNYKEAIINYKKAALINSDFYYKIANAFELNNKKDSALKYYRIFQNNNPQDSEAAKKIVLLAK